MHISRSIFFLFWGFTGISLHDSQFKNSLFILHWSFMQPLSSTVCLKQVFFSCYLFKAILLMIICSDWLASRSCISAEALSTNSSSGILLLFLLLYSKWKPLKHICTCSSSNPIQNMSGQCSQPIEQS